LDKEKQEKQLDKANKFFKIYKITKIKWFHKKFLSIMSEFVAEVLYDKLNNEINQFVEVKMINSKPYFDTSKYR